MRNKIFIACSFIIILLLTFYSCQKFETKTKVEIEQEDVINNAKFSPEFNWETSNIINFNISAEVAQTICITSIDKSIRYHKAMHPGESNTFVIRLSVPNHITKLSINSQEVDLSSNNISIEL